MNILLLDMGNTRLKWAVLQKGLDQNPLGQYGDCRHAGGDMAQILTKAWSGLSGIGQVLLASVASDEIEAEVWSWVERVWGLPVELLRSPASGGGVVNGYAEPDCLGVDRWLGLVGARQLTAAPVCVVDCGTAVTIDRLDGSGFHQGGLILPGLAMMAQALTLGADRLPGDIGLSELIAAQNVAGLARDTTSGLAAGVLTTLVAAIDRIVVDVDRDDGASAWVLTGGDGLLLQPLLAGQWLYRPNLVLEGMAHIAGEME